MGIHILGTGSYTPAFEVTNADMAKIVETSDEWIRTRTGIQSRHIADGEPTWYMGAQASRRAIEMAGIDPMELSLIIDTTITPDFSTPSVSCIVQRELGAKNAACMDLNAACSGFVYGVETAHCFLSTHRDMKYALVVANENLTRITNYSDRSSCILFGDGAAAAVIAYREGGLYSSYLSADGTGAKYLYARTATPDNPFCKRKAEYDDGIGAGPEGWEHTMRQDGKEVYRFAVKAMPEAAQRAAEKIGFALNDLDKIVPHQANIRIIETAMKNLNLPMEKVILKLSHHGNTSSASIPIALDEAVRAGEIQRGNKICLVGFGAGLTMACVITEF